MCGCLYIPTRVGRPGGLARHSGRDKERVSASALLTMPDKYGGAGEPIDIMVLDADEKQIDHFIGHFIKLLRPFPGVRKDYLINIYK